MKHLLKWIIKNLWNKNLIFNVEWKKNMRIVEKDSFFCYERLSQMRFMLY